MTPRKFLMITVMQAYTNNDHSVHAHVIAASPVLDAEFRLEHPVSWCLNVIDTMKELLQIGTYDRMHRRTSYQAADLNNDYTESMIRFEWEYLAGKIHETIVRE